MWPTFVGINLGPLAQSVEQRTFNPWVDGSSPSGPTFSGLIYFGSESLGELNTHNTYRLKIDNIKPYAKYLYLREMSYFQFRKILSFRSNAVSNKNFPPTDL